MQLDRSDWRAEEADLRERRAWRAKKRKGGEGGRTTSANAMQRLALRADDGDFKCTVVISIHLPRGIQEASD